MSGLNINMGGGQEIIIEKLELRLSKPYDETSTSGLVGYIDSLENAFLELNEYGIDKSEAEKHCLLKRNLFVKGITDNLVMQMDEKYKSSSQCFTRVVKWLRAKVMQLDYHRGSHAHKEAKKRRSARLASTVDPDTLAQLLSTYDVAANLARNSQDWISRHIFEQLAPEMKDAYATGETITVNPGNTGNAIPTIEVFVPMIANNMIMLTENKTITIPLSLMRQTTRLPVSLRIVSMELFQNNTVQSRSRPT
jgi:hypothetical protein